MISQDDIGRIREEGIRSIDVRLEEAGNRDFTGRLLRITPAATNHLPSIALGDRGGGNLVTDTGDKDGLTALEPVFLVDVELPQHNILRTGGRAWVRFGYGKKTLADTMTWRFRQLFLKLFSTEKQ